MSDAVKKTEGEYIELKVEDFKKLLMLARCCQGDYFTMSKLLSFKNLDENAKDCIHRMEFRKPIFKVLDKFKEYKL